MRQLIPQILIHGPHARTSLPLCEDMDLSSELFNVSDIDWGYLGFPTEKDTGEDMRYASTVRIEMDAYL